MIEAVLLDVVAQPELERGIDLRLFARERVGDARLHGLGAIGAGAQLGQRRHLARRRSAIRRRAAAATSRSQTRSSGSNCAARASTSPSGPMTTLPPSKTSSSCPPDHVAEREGGSVGARPLGNHRLAGPSLAPVVRGRRRVDDQPGARRRLVALRKSRMPDVLADRQADRHAVDFDQRRLAAGLEVAALVEDAVVGQVALSVDAPHLALGHYRERVMGRGRGRVDQGIEVLELLRRALDPLREADQGDDPLDVRRRRRRGPGRTAARKSRRRRRSSGGYPERQSSGKTTSCAP